ncbi:MAG: hypothetical protein HQM10_22975 [Candidatus Riflebacteria bacterium]|nr:hypothetical protein [Candidatus Riflebacteria bacterium]
MKMKFILVLFCCLSLSLSPVFSADTPNKLVLKVQNVTKPAFEKLGNAVIKSFKNLSDSLDSRKNIKLSIKSSFYDPDFRRVFLAFAGNIELSKHIPVNREIKSVLLTGDGMFGYDIYVKEISPATAENPKYEFSGDLIISLDDVVFDLAKQITLVTSVVNYSETTTVLIQFFDMMKIDLLVDAIADTVTDFSPESFRKAKEVVKDHFSKGNVSKLSELISSGMKEGEIGHFFAATLLKYAAVKGMTIVGGTVGAAAGGVLSGGPGVVVGAFLGIQISFTIADMMIFKLTTNLPVSIFIKRIANSSRFLSRNPGSPAELEKIKINSTKILEKMRFDIGNSDYRTYDLVMTKVGSYTETERIYFLDLLKNVQELLRFKLIDQKDWYANKKLLQFRSSVNSWGLSSHFNY